MRKMPNHYIIIFDGVCNLCNGAVNFIIKRDSRGVFVFTPMQSPSGQSLLQEYPLLHGETETLLLIKNGRCHLRGDAVLEISRELSGLRSLWRILSIIPGPYRDYLYKMVAKYRYLLFGKKGRCMTPHIGVRSRFLYNPDDK